MVSGGQDTENQDERLEVPSCIESLVSSSHQLRQLANHVDKFYIKTLLCYGQACAVPSKDAQDQPKREYHQKLARNKSLANSEPVLNSNEIELNLLSDDEASLEALSLIVELFPLLEEVTSFIERCFMTIESAIKRCVYHLGKIPKRPRSDMSSEIEFKLTPDVRINSLLIALIDLLYTLESLDKVIRNQTNVSQSLRDLIRACELITNCRASSSGVIDQSLPILNDLARIEDKSFEAIVQFVYKIENTLCGQRTLLEQAMEYVQSLEISLSSNNKTQMGFKEFLKQCKTFLYFYADNLIDIDFSALDRSISTNLKLANTNLMTVMDASLIPTLYMMTKTRRLFGFFALFIFYSSISKDLDKRTLQLANQTMNCSRGVGLIDLLGNNCHLIIDELVSRPLFKSVPLKQTLKKPPVLKDILLRIDPSDCLDKFTAQALIWLSELKAEFPRPSDSVDRSITELMDWRRLRLINEGLYLMETIDETVRASMAIHVHLGEPIIKSDLVPLFRLVALLKSIENNLMQFETSVGRELSTIEMSFKMKWRKSMLSIKKRLLVTRYTDRKLDMKTLFMLIALCSDADSVFDSQRGRDVLSLCLPLLIPSLESRESVEISKLILSRPRSIRERFASSSCDYLYWSIPTFAIYYNYVFEEDPSVVEEVFYFHMALDDIKTLFSINNQPTWSSLDLSWLTIKRDEFVEKLKDGLVEQFKVNFIERICREFEIELRLQTHPELHPNSHNPFNRQVYNFKKILAFSGSSQNFRIFDHSLSLRYNIEQHLNRVCYNLTALSPYDGFTYDKMMNLARQRFNLHFVNPQLPSQTPSQGQDLLDITRNLALFVSRNSYDLINQLFIEKSKIRLSTSASALSSSSITNVTQLVSQPTSGALAHQLLDVFQLKHITRSIQTHGYGILNNSVNCAYQVMKRLINIVSKQTSDENFSLIILKEAQRVQTMKTSGSLGVGSSITGKLTALRDTNSPNEDHGPGKQPLFPFDRANSIVKRLRFKRSTSRHRLHQSVSKSLADQQDSRVDLDQLRQSITQLGNLVGFIRMLKSGALKCASRPVDYLPDPENLSSNEKLSGLIKAAASQPSDFGADEGLAKSCIPSEILIASENYDRCIEDLSENFTSKTNYFGIIISLFKEFLQKTSEKPPNSAQNDQESSQNNSKTDGDTSIASPSTVDGDSNGNQAQRKESSVVRTDHLIHFYLLVPALTINYIDYLISCEERIASRSSSAKHGALIRDDGFPLGLAFLLSVLGQTEQFGHFEWFVEIRRKLGEDKREVERRLVDSNYEESLKQTASMTLRRLNKLLVEYNELEHTLSCALLLLRSVALPPVPFVA